MKKLWKVLKIVVGAYAIQTIMSILAVIAYVVIKQPDINNIEIDVVYLYLMVGTILSTIPSIIYILRKYPRKESKINVKKLLLMIPFGFGVSWVFNMLTINIQEENILLKLPFLLLVIFTVILGPIFEELVFRYVALRNGEEVYSKKKALIVSAVIFGLLHSGIIGIIYAFLIGLLLGRIYQKENNIVYSIVLHMVANLASLFVIEFSVVLLIVGISLLVVAGYGYRKLTY